MIKDFFMPDASHGFYIQYRVMNYDVSVRRHFPVSKFWSDKDLQSIRADRVYFFSPCFRPYLKNVVIGSYVVWSDFDGVDISDIDFRGFLPSLAVLSGGGVHAYWRFDDFVPAEDLSFALDLVVTRFGSDVLARDVTRFMRVPMSFNHKFTPPRICSVLSRGRDYDFSSFVRGLMSLSVFERTHTPSPLDPFPRVLSLYRRGSVDGRFWFWQPSQPYRVGSGDFVKKDFLFSTLVTVSVLGGSDVLYRGELGSVPDSLRGYLTEVCIL